MHLTASSGCNFVHHLFDAAISTVKFLNKPVDDRVNDVQRSSAVVETRVGILEQQFASFQKRNHFEFAAQQELNDWHENQANERFFVVTGLPVAPSKLSGGDLITILVVQIVYYFNLSSF